MNAVTHVLVAVDLSEATPLLIAYARQLAEAWKARLTVLHVVHDLSSYGGVFITSKPLNKMQQELETEARERLDAWCEDVHDGDITCATLMATGRPLAEVSRIIRELEVDCLVIGAHSMDKPEHQLFGSTAERLLHHIQCPTLVVPPQRVDYVSTV